MTSNKFKIQILSKKWLFEPSENDLCAHGQLKVEIGDEIIVDEKNDDGWTISATAQLLLRTLERDHSKKEPVGDQLIPCCGHFLVYDDDMEEVYVGSCPSGFDWEVKHKDDKIILKTENGIETQIDFVDYKTKVLEFVDEVEQFYKDSLKKEIPSDEFDQKGYLQFWKEWHEKRNKWE